MASLVMNGSCPFLCSENKSCQDMSPSLKDGNHIIKKHGMEKITLSSIFFRIGYFGSNLC